MTSYPTTRPPSELIGTIASLFIGGNGPTHSQIGTATASAGLDDQWPGGPKDARVASVFRQANVSEAYRFIDELLGMIRNSNEFLRSDSTWAPRVRESFRRAGGVLDEHGYVTWNVEPPAPFAQTSVANITGAITQVAEASDRLQREQAAKARQAAGVTGIEGRSSSPHAEIRPSRAHGAGEAHESGIPEPKTSTEDPGAEHGIFLVHGHKINARREVELFILDTTGIRPTVLQAKSSAGRTIIEKFEDHAGPATYAVVLMTADDIGQTVEDQAVSKQPELRGRQNVILEYGYFLAKLGRPNVVALVESEVVVPSDLAGLGYVRYGSDARWEAELRDEMRDAGLPIIR